MASQDQLDDIMNQTTYLEYLYVILKAFNIKAAFIDELLICYFQYGLGLLIQSYFDENNKNINDQEEVIERSVDVKTKMAYQLISVM